MCTALLSVEPGRPVLLVGVRDEIIDRAWRPPGQHWPQYPGLTGGLDLQAGGTWLAVAPGERRAACVLNGRGHPAPEATRRSRGSLPLAAAAGQKLDRAILGDFDPFHLLTVEAGHGEPASALSQIWDGNTLTEASLTEPSLHFAVNSGWAASLGTVAADDTGTGNGRAHELARIGYFLPRFLSASRPDPRPGQPVAEAWGEWFPLLNGAGIDPGDDRALLPCRDLGGGQIWGTTSVSLVALSPDFVRYDFTGSPGDPGAWISPLT
ncbi:MAG TPA: NRDE family protein [Streptosporangiaceae bacterium]|nr:NRDE family protein [Streptosporangiaceae bacterium]